MKTHFVSEFEPNQLVTSFFLVHQKEVRLNKSGQSYLSMLLADRTGVVDAKMWEGAEEAAAAFDRDDFVKIRALVQVHRHKPQLNVHKIRRAGAGEVDVADYFPRTEKNVDEMWTELRAAVAAIAEPHLRALADSFLDDPEIARRYRTAPAAKTVHHARIGGLLEHVISLLRLCRFAAGHYSFVDPDLLIAGAVLHDLGKIYELTYERSFGYTAEGQLIGHISMLLNLIQQRAAAIPGFPPKLQTLLEHVVLSHHGREEFGSPKRPMIPEALLLHHLDNLDSKMECMRAAIAGDRNLEGVWTSYNAALETAVLKKDKFLADPPGEPTPAPIAEDDGLAD